MRLFAKVQESLMNEHIYISPKRNGVHPLWKWASYFFDITIESSETPYPLEIALSKGNFQLNSLHANQSNGTLKLAFHHAFHQLGIYGLSLEKVLILGLGLGSVVDLLQKRCSIQQMTAYENNPTILGWLEKYYEILNIKILPTSAQYMSDDHSYQLIIIDLFVDEELPVFLSQKEWWERIQSMLSSNGIMIWNTLSKNQISLDIQDIFDTSVSTLDNRFYVKRLSPSTIYAEQNSQVSPSPAR